MRVSLAEPVGERVSVPDGVVDGVLVGDAPADMVAVGVAVALGVCDADGLPVSLLLALGDRDGALPTMRAHAQEHDDAVLMQHVDLYVNEWTVNLGPVGMRALEELSARAASIGLGTGRRLEIFAGCGK